MTRYVALVIMLAMSACAPQVLDVSTARQQFERKHQTNLARGTLKILDFRKTNGQRMTMFGVNHHELRYEAILNDPKSSPATRRKELARLQNTVRIEPPIAFPPHRTE